MSKKQRSEFHGKVSPSLIKELVDTAIKLTNEQKHITAFLLLYPAYEALMFRACVKALWLRGYNVGDSERFIVKFQQIDDFWWEFFKWCCGCRENDLPFDTGHIYFDAQKFLREIRELRGLLIHGVKVPAGENYQTMQDANKIIIWIITSQVMGEARVKIRDEIRALGDPLEKLGRPKRRSNLQLLEELPRPKKFRAQIIPKRPPMTPRLKAAIDLMF